MKKIGVLGLQGAVTEHLRQLQQLGYEGVNVKKVEQLAEIEGLIIPGGESTAIRNLMNRYGFIEPLKQFEKPILGTCAGMVLLAGELAGSTEAHLGLMDIRVRRNAFGRQIDSFEIDLDVEGISELVPAVFIRAPFIETVGEDVEVLAEIDGYPVAARQGNYLVSSFHPELTADTNFLKLFTEMVEQARLSTAMQG